MNRAYHEATITVLASILFLIVPARGWGVEQHYVVDDTQSHITFAAHSTGHNFQGQSSQISGRFGYEAQRIAESGDGEVHIPIRSIQTGISARDSRMYQSFDADHFPEILFRVRRLSGTEHMETTLFSGRLVGELSIKGVTKEIPVTLVVTPGENRQLVIKGTTSLRMTDFNIEPPGFLLFRVDEEVQIAFRVVGKAE